jgi:hypothetical protein
MLCINFSDLEVSQYNQSIGMAHNDENKECTTLVWCNSNMGSQIDTETTIQNHHHINDYVIFYTDLEKCIAFIESIDKRK